MNRQGAFTAPPKQRSPLFRYGMLVVALLLLAFHISWQLSLPPDYPYDRYGSGVIALMLLLNNLAYQFRWSTPVTAGLRLRAWGWIAFGCFYIFYWSHTLYPHAR